MAEDDYPASAALGLVASACALIIACVVGLCAAVWYAIKGLLGGIR